jgi:hypothetical protein
MPQITMGIQPFIKERIFDYAGSYSCLVLNIFKKVTDSTKLQEQFFSFPPSQKEHTFPGPE